MKTVQRCIALTHLLNEHNFPSVGIHRAMAQEERLKKYQEFKDFHKVSLTMFVFLVLKYYFTLLLQTSVCPFRRFPLYTEMKWASKKITSVSVG